LHFLGTFWGQVLLSVGSVCFLLIAKKLSRRPGDRKGGNNPFERDDFAIGLDLLVLSIVTLTGYAVLQYQAELVAQQKKDPAAVASAELHQNKAFQWIGIAFLAFVAVVWLLQWLGQYPDDKRAALKRAEFERQRNNGALAKLRERQPNATEVELALEISDPPRNRGFFGLFLPTALGILMLMFAVQVVTR
jgi:hypothetical protein